MGVRRVPLIPLECGRTPNELALLSNDSLHIDMAPGVDVLRFALRLLQRVGSLLNMQQGVRCVFRK